MDLEDLKKILDYFDQYDLNSLKVKDRDFEISLKKDHILSRDPKTTIETHHEESTCKVVDEPIEENIQGTFVKSPLVGTFYMAPSPDQDPFVKPGDQVEEGQVLCIIESMKMFNEIKSDLSGTVEEVLVEDGQMVEFDQDLFKVRKLDA